MYVVWYTTQTEHGPDYAAYGPFSSVALASRWIAKMLEKEGMEGLYLIAQVRKPE